jgi:SAM-dependent methyltransferase
MLQKKYNLSSSGVWTRPDKIGFDYSDGDDVENRLLKQLQKANDVSLASDELQRLIIDWPSEYHFSPLRPNLLSSFQLEQFATILEIGSGCGAVTRLLGEQCPYSTIVALEGSLRRAEITKARCRDLSNVHVCRESFSNFDNDNLFDLITMIGVLEYSPSFSDENNPVLALLQRARHLLDSDGALVIAIENQLGLKYFNGCSEDHTGKAFLGINDMYAPGTVRTFGRYELLKEIEQAGFNRVEFVYPFPDYKLPQLLLREESFLDGEIDLASLVGHYPARDYAHDGDKIFQEAKVWNLLYRNELLRDMANSFLVFAFKGDKSLNDITDPWMVKAFSCRRKKRYIIETVFSRSGKAIVVEKKLCYPLVKDQDHDDAEGITHRIGFAEYVKAAPYSNTLTSQVSGGDSFDNFVSYLSPWVEWLQDKTLPLSTIEGNERLMVPGTLYDCIPANFLINDQKELCLIDQEWESENPLELGFLLFRGLYSEFSANLDYFEQTDLFADETAGDLLTNIFERFNLPFNQDILAKYIDQEITFQLALVPYNTGREGLRNHFQTFFRQKRTRKASLGDLLTTGDVGQQSSLLWQKKMADQALAQQEKEISDLKQQLADKDKVVAEIFQSKSWRLTGPLRFAGYLLQGDFNKAGMMIKEMKQSLANTPKRLAKWLSSNVKE